MRYTKNAAIVSPQYFLLACAKFTTEIFFEEASIIFY